MHFPVDGHIRNDATMQHNGHANRRADKLVLGQNSGRFAETIHIAHVRTTVALSEKKYHRIQAKGWLRVEFAG